MDVVHVSGEIDLVANRVLPKTPLPKCKLTICVAFDDHTFGK